MWHHKESDVATKSEIEREQDRKRLIVVSCKSNMQILKHEAIARECFPQTEPLELDSSRHWLVSK